MWEAARIPKARLSEAGCGMRLEVQGSVFCLPFRVCLFCRVFVVLFFFVESAPASEGVRVLALTSLPASGRRASSILGERSAI